jgi:hypothetical protein
LRDLVELARERTLELGTLEVTAAGKTPRQLADAEIGPCDSSWWTTRVFGLSRKNEPGHPKTEIRGSKQIRSRNAHESHERHERRDLCPTLRDPRDLYESRLGTLRFFSLAPAAGERGHLGLWRGRTSKRVDVNRCHEHGGARSADRRVREWRPFGLARTRLSALRE